MFLLSARSAYAQQELPPTILWSSCTSKNVPTLEGLAVQAKPLLWFSRDEPLVTLGGPLVREWPRTPPGTVDPSLASTGDLVYYRFTKIKGVHKDSRLVTAWTERLTGQ